MTRLVNHLFLTVGLFSLLAFGVFIIADMPPDRLPGSIILAIWRVGGFALHATANLLERIAPGLPGWLDSLLVIILGLLPYATADWLLRLMRRRGRVARQSAGRTD